MFNLTNSQAMFINVNLCNWNLNNEGKRQISVRFNWIITRIFDYRDYESVKDILFGFKLFLLI